MVHGDGVRLAQVFANLLHNAVEVRRRLADGSASQARREGDEAVVRITDSGIGIPAELLTRMFELFVQGPARARRARASGCRWRSGWSRCMAALSPRIATAPGKGSEFTVRLPLTSAA